MELNLLSHIQMETFHRSLCHEASRTELLELLYAPRRKFPVRPHHIDLFRIDGDIWKLIRDVVIDPAEEIVGRNRDHVRSRGNLGLIRFRQRVGLAHLRAARNPNG